MGYTLRKELGSRRIFSKNKKMGYALYYNGSPVYPKFRNWWPTKAQGQATIRKAQAEKRASKKRSTKGKKRKKKKR